MGEALSLSERFRTPASLAPDAIASVPQPVTVTPANCFPPDSCCPVYRQHARTFP